MKSIIEAIDDGKLVYTDELRDFFLEKSQKGDWGNDVDLMFRLPNAEHLLLAYLENGHKLPESEEISNQLKPYLQFTPILKLLIEQDYELNADIFAAVGTNPKSGELLHEIVRKGIPRGSAKSYVTQLLALISEQPEPMQYYTVLLHHNGTNEAYFSLLNVLEDNFVSEAEKKKFVTAQQMEQIVKLNLEHSKVLSMGAYGEAIMLRKYPEMVKNYISRFWLTNEAETTFFADCEHFSDELKKFYISVHPNLCRKARQVLLQREDAKTWVDYFADYATEKNSEEFLKEYAQSHGKKSWIRRLFS